MRLVRLTNDHKVAVFVPDPERDNDKAYHKKIQIALLELAPKGWYATGRSFVYNAVGNERQYNVNSYGDNSITHSKVGHIGDDWGGGVDIIEEVRESTRVIDFNKIG